MVSWRLFFPLVEIITLIIYEEMVSNPTYETLPYIPIPIDMTIMLVVSLLLLSSEVGYMNFIFKHLYFTKFFQVGFPSFYKHLFWEIVLIFTRKYLHLHSRRILNPGLHINTSPITLILAIRPHTFFLMSWRIQLVETMYLYPILSIIIPIIFPLSL